MQSNPRILANLLANLPRKNLGVYIGGGHGGADPPYEPLPGDGLPESPWTSMRAIPFGSGGCFRSSPAPDGPPESWDLLGFAGEYSWSL